MTWLRRQNFTLSQDTAQYYMRLARLERDELSARRAESVRAALGRRDTDVEGSGGAIRVLHPRAEDAR
jgi:hypothetical protein